jgi:GMP synthase (glutamine-hydrolysing)
MTEDGKANMGQVIAEPPANPQSDLPRASAAMTIGHHERVLILDFGAQYTQLIARRVRENGVYCEIMPFNVAENRIADFERKAVIL